MTTSWPPHVTWEVIHLLAYHAHIVWSLWTVVLTAFKITLWMPNGECIWQDRIFKSFFSFFKLNLYKFSLHIWNQYEQCFRVSTKEVKYWSCDSWISSLYMLETMCWNITFCMLKPTIVQSNNIQVHDDDDETREERQSHACVIKW